MISRFSPELKQALAAGCFLVTPNNRMARTLTRAHDAAQRASGASVWPTARVCPYSGFIECLWRQLSAVMSLPQRLNDRASRVLWSTIIERDAEELSLYETAGVSALAQETWRLMHLWRSAGDETPWRHWRREGGGITVDTARFARWAERYHKRLLDGGFVDDALVPDFIIRHASQFRGAERVWTMAGFDDHTPQALRLLSALRAAGFDISEVPSLGGMAGESTAGRAFQFQSRNKEAELCDALNWAWKETHHSHHTRQVAIVIPSLSAQRRSVCWQVEDLLPEPSFCNVSLGEPLAQKALVSTALELLTLMDQPLPTERVAALLRSAYLPGDFQNRMKRATLARRWIEVGKREVSWHEAVTALACVDSVLSERWREASGVFPVRAECGSWPRHVLGGWHALGWPGSQTLDSVDYQVRDKWMSCIEALPTLEAVMPQMTRQRLAQTLRQWATETLFQPEGGHAAPIQILGVLEAAGLPFDALWVTGLDGGSWPPPVTPHSLLPLAWQRTNRMPHTTVDQTMAYAERTQAHWQRMGKEVILSYPAESDEQPTTTSPLLATLPNYSAQLETLQSRMARAPKVQLETLDDHQAPPVMCDGENRIVEAIRHGSAVLVNQSCCPFKAFASTRLSMSSWQETGEGLLPHERGTFVHAVLQKFWSRLGSQEALLALDPDALDRQIDAAYRDAVPGKNESARERWRLLPSAMALMEREHIRNLLRDWCDVERRRAPFQVAHIEKNLTLDLAGMRYTLRADRIDTLEDGGVVLLDYKTGKPEPIKTCFEPRPTSVQLGLYALAWQALPETTDSVKALLYASLREEGAKASGLTVDNASWPGLTVLKKLGVGSMEEAQQRWREIYTALTQAFLSGDARVLPRNKQSCKTCDVKPLCRINMEMDDEGEGSEEDNE